MLKQWMISNNPKSSANTFTSPQIFRKITQRFFLLSPNLRGETASIIQPFTTLVYDTAHR